MQKTSFFPPFIRTLSVLFIGTLLALVLARGAMLGILWPEVAENPASDILNALYIGTKFDIRMVVLGLIPIALILGIPPLERLLVRSRGFRGLIDLLYAAVFAAATLVYIIDFGWFFYMHTRVDASLFELLGDPDIAGTMVWESYPVVWITFGLIVVTALYALFFGKTLARHEATPRLGWKGRTGWSVATFVILFLLGYGQISSNLFPLRWSNAFFSVDKNISILALNPIQNLFDTVNAARGTRPDIEATRESYPRVAAWLRVPNPDPQKLDFMRTVPGTPAERQEKPLNVVVIIMESMTWPRTSFSPNLTGIPEDTTPNLMALSKDSLYYPLFFAPTRTTARAIFTTMTGIPDVNRSGGTSSRNQALVDQALMMNEFKGYSKYYMIGGSASWANIRGFLSHNIEGLHLLEEGSWKAPNTDVWGLSDLDLFREAAAALTKSPKPFVAVIQTAGFHRPYTIPEDNAGFQIKQPSEAILKNYGFTGADEYNSLRFSDHSLGEFFKIARQQPWFDNTVFAIFGDHGLNDTSLNMSPGYLACRLQSNHTPMLIYAPGLVAAGKLQPGVDGRPCGQPDIFPTLASLAGIPYRYNAMGRNLLDPDTKRDEMQFLGGETESTVRLVENGYCYIRETDEHMYKMDAPVLEDLLNTDPERAAHMRHTRRTSTTLPSIFCTTIKSSTNSERPLSSRRAWGARNGSPQPTKAGVCASAFVGCGRDCIPHGYGCIP